MPVHPALQIATFKLKISGSNWDHNNFYLFIFIPSLKRGLFPSQLTNR